MIVEYYGLLSRPTFGGIDMDATSLAIASALLWIGSHTTYNIHTPWPTVNYVSRAALQKKAEKDSSFPISSKNEDLEIVGLYYKNTDAIFLIKGSDLQSPEEKSTLFHEVFHHVQTFNKKKEPATENGREREAYAFENKWREEHHLKPTYVPKLFSGQAKN